MQKDAEQAWISFLFLLVPQSAAAAISERLSTRESVGCTEPPVQIRAF